MFKFYVVPDATKLSSHSAIYSSENMKLFWDPRSESDAYAIVEAKGKSEINKASSLEFSILPTNVCYNDFYKKKSVVLAYDDDQLIFEGEVSTNPRDFYKQRRITCTDPLTYLSGSIQPPDEKNEVVVPESSSGTLYIKVPLIWYEDGNPKKLQWYERTKNGSGELEYSVSKDTTANPNKVYYYTVTSSGENVSGTTITKSAATRESIQAHISRILNVHNTQADPFRQIFPGTIDNSDSAEHDFASTGWRTSWDAFNSDILESYGRCAKITTGNNGTLLLNYVDIKQMSSISPVIEYTRNMIEMTESTDNNGDIFTVLVPIGKDNLTVSGVSGHGSGGDGEVDPYVVSWGGAKRYVVVSKKAVARYGYIVKTQSFSDIESTSELYNKAVEFIKNNYDYHTEYDVKAIDLKVLGEADHRISVGDKCRLKSAWHGVDEQDLYVISAQYDYINPENDSFKLGIPTSDKEAGNRRLSSQTSKNKKSSSKNAANAASSAGRLSSILENYIHVTEWGLEMNSRLKNEVESADKKYTTRFIQDEEHLNLAAEKLFGIDADGRGDKDAGYVRVLTSEYRDGDGPYKNPVTEHWFEKKNGEYVLSTDTTCDPSVVGNKTYYIQRLWSRYSDIDVGAGGIKARVDGNYETSTYCSSWIQANEDQILSLTGHLYVDDNGHAHIHSGSGMRTDHQETKTTESFIHVQSSMYAQNPNPKAKGWYERVFDSSGKWIGQGQADFQTNSNYYKLSNDTTVDRNKFYYFKSYIRDEFVSEYGVYDEDNLVGGIITRMINNPQFHPVNNTIVEQLANNAGNPRAQGWYEYNDITGTFGITSDTQVPRDSNGRPVTNKYYTATNNYQTYSDIWGEHIVVGRTAGYSSMDAATKARVSKYITDNNLNGTITEIASDVVVVNALIAKYIETDTITVNSNLASDYIWSNHITSHNEINASTYMCAPDFWLLTNPDREPGAGDSIKTGLLSVSTSNGSDNNLTVAPTYSGDNVTLSFYTRDQQLHTVTFTKPASLGSVTWSSGSKTLTAKTVGGRDFLVGTITPFSPSGQSEAQEMASAGYLATETTGYNTVYGINYTAKDANNKDWARKTMLFKTPRNRYPDAVSTIKTYSSDNKTDGTDITLAYGTNVKIFAQYQTELQFDSGDKKQITNCTGITVRHDAIGVDGPATFTPSNQSEAQEAANATELAYGQTYSISGTYGGSRVGTRKLFRTKTDRYSTGYSDAIGTVRIRSDSDYGNESTIALGYGGSTTIRSQYKAEGSNAYTNDEWIKVTAPADRYNSGKDDGANTLTISPSSDKTLDYGQSQTVTATTTKSDGTTVTKSVTITAPGDNSSPSYDCDDIRVGETDIKSSKPSDATELSWGSSIFSADGRWFIFEAWLNGQNGTKKYAINLS